MENCHESCVFVDNDAQAKLLKCILHSADAGLVLNDRAHAEITRCDMRLFRRGAIGQVCWMHLPRRTCCEPLSGVFSGQEPVF